MNLPGWVVGRVTKTFVQMMDNALAKKYRDFDLNFGQFLYKSWLDNNIETKGFYETLENVDPELRDYFDNLPSDQYHEALSKFAMIMEIIKYNQKE